MRNYRNESDIVFITEMTLKFVLISEMILGAPIPAWKAA